MGRSATHDMTALEIDANGRVVIPAAIRRALKVRPGDHLVGWLENGRLVIRPRADVLRDLRERFQPRAGQERLVETLTKMRAAESRRAARR